MMSEPSLSELVAKIRAGLESLPDGPWKSAAMHIYVPGENGANICSVGEPRAGTTVGYTELSLGSKDFELAADIKNHIARMSKPNITRLLDALEASEAKAARLRDVLRLCVDALNESDPIHDDYWAAAKAGEDVLNDLHDPDELPPNYAACCSSTDLNACDCVSKQHIRVLVRKGRPQVPTDRRKAMTAYFADEMWEALEADGEKLRQLTGEDHGPWFIEDCPECGGRGHTVHGYQVYEAGCGFPHDDAYERKCDACDGFGTIVVQL